VALAGFGSFVVVSAPGARCALGPPAPAPGAPTTAPAATRGQAAPPATAGTPRICQHRRALRSPKGAREHIVVGSAASRLVGGIDLPSGLLLGFGSALLVAGFFIPGEQTAFATALIAVGAGLVALGALSRFVAEFELGLTGVKMKLAQRPPGPIALGVKADQLPRFAALVLGDPEQAREVVEDALARSQQRGKRLSESERDTLALRLLIELLDTAPLKSLLRGKSQVRRDPAGRDVVAPADSRVLEALKTLPFPERVAFLLRLDLSLSLEEIAALLGQSPKEAERDFDRARNVVERSIAVEAAPTDDK
jgi:RNA polymerase sigma-70 factor, ECF subfamily